MKLHKKLACLPLNVLNFIRTFKLYKYTTYNLNLFFCASVTKKKLYNIDTCSFSIKSAISSGFSSHPFFFWLKSSFWAFHLKNMLKAKSF
jgi:hypothetical protein